MTTESTYGQALRARRERRGISLRQAARAWNIDPSYLSQIERGLRPGPPEIAHAADTALEAHGALEALFATAAAQRRRQSIPRVVPVLAAVPLPWGHCGPACRGCEVMTELAALVESVRISLAVGGTSATEAAEAAVETFALDYSRHAPAHVFAAVAGYRTAIGGALELARREAVARSLRDCAGWASLLLGNLAEHLGRDPRVHLTAAHSIAIDVGDARLACHARNLQALHARLTGDLPASLAYATNGLELAPDRTERARLAAAGQLPTLAAMHDATGAATARSIAEGAFSDDTPGRFGFDAAELHLYFAEAALALDRPGDALGDADTSAIGLDTSRPAWVAARLTGALAHATAGRFDAAAEVAHEVLDITPPDRLRATSRARLARLAARSELGDIRDRVAALPALAA